MKTILLLATLLSSHLWAQDYPTEWWKPVPREEAASWEILPQEAAAGEVILSKRTELGIFSNFGATPFSLDGRTYASVEGLWQAMKYPDPALPEDPRHRVSEWPHKRSEVMAMVGSVAKDAGSKANALYKKHGLKNISYADKFFDYTDHAEGSRMHLDVIARALRAKLDQNPELWALLLKTGCLKLRPDHKPGQNEPPAYRYYEIYMQLREERAPCSSR